MSIEDAVRLAIIDYCNKHHITPTEFGRKAEISKTTISKIMNHRYGKVGIPGVMLDLIANGMDLTAAEFRKLITEYQNGKTPSPEELEKQQVISLISKRLENLKDDEVMMIYRIILNFNIEQLKDIDLKLRKNME